MVATGPLAPVPLPPDGGTGRAWPVAPLRLDPRISTRPPGWLPADTNWRDVSMAYELDDVEWIGRQWDLAGGPEQQNPTGWITMETIGGWDRWAIAIVLGVPAGVLVVAYVLWLALAGVR